MKTAILQLKKFVCTCALAGAVAAKRIPESTGMTRWCEWEEKRQLGIPTRHALLAYAFARGRPYASLEAKVREGNGPSAHRVEALLQEAGLPFEAGAVEAWLRGESKKVEAAA